MEACHLAVLEATESYNASGEIPEIYFAAGYALSSEFPFLCKDCHKKGYVKIVIKRENAKNSTRW